MPFAEGRTMVGWGVIRPNPWAFDGIYETREEAEAEASKLGSDYLVKWGEQQGGTDNFIWAEGDQSGEIGASPDQAPPSASEATRIKVDPATLKMSAGEVQVRTQRRIATEPADYLLTPGGADLRAASPEVQAAGAANGSGNAAVEGVTGHAVAPEAAAESTDDPKVAIQVHDAVSATKASSPTIAAHDPPGLTEFKATTVMASANWTGRRSREEQATIVKAFAQPAADAVDQLCRAIRDKRRNDPADQEALEALKELHHALGELIGRAERGEGMDAVWRTYELHKERVYIAMKRGAGLVGAAPLATIAIANLLSWLSGVPAGEGMLGAIYGALVGSEALRSRKGN